MRLKQFPSWDKLATLFFICTGLGIAADILSSLSHLPRPPLDYFSIGVFGFISWMCWRRWFRLEDPDEDSTVRESEHQG